MCAGSTWYITWHIMWHILDVMRNLIAVSDASTPEVIHICFGIAQMNRAGANLIRNELQTKTDCPYANVDGFVDSQWC